MKKLIPVIIAIALIGVIVFVNFGKTVYEKYSYGQDRADLNEYFKIYNTADVPIVLQDALIDMSAVYVNGTCYMARDLIEEYFTDRFYLDSNENLLLYTMADHVAEAVVGETTYNEMGQTYDLGYPISFIKDDVLFVAVDYIKKFVNFSYEVFENPRHMQIYTEWGEKTVADIKSDTQVRWLAGVKSDILADVVKGETVEVLEELDDWTKVKTKESYIGYLEHSKLSEYTTVAETPVTEVNEKFVSLTEDRLINMTWHYMEYPQDGYNLREALAGTTGINVVSPTWYWITDNEGSFKSVSNEHYVQTAHEMGIEVWALIADFHAGIEADINEVLSYTSKRRLFEDNLVADLLAMGADGINVDFENITVSGADHYVQFIRELALKCHENDLKLSVDHYAPTEYTAHYNRGAQSKFADYIVIMGYDEHYVGSDVGSVSSIPWMKQGIENTLKYVPGEKVINAIPFYTRVWKTTDGVVESEAVDMETAQNFLAKHNLTAEFDAETNQNYAEVTLGNTFYQVWMEDTDSIAIRLNVMKTYGIAGVSSWQLGQETKDVWPVIETYINHQ